MTVTFDFSGRKVVVTGGSRGIGRGIARAFLERGASVSICARSEDTLERTRSELAEIGPIHAAVCDLGNRDSVRAYVASAAEALGGIDILVNNASSISRGHDEAAWLEAVNIDLLGNIRMCEAALPWLEKATDAAIIHIGSITAFRVSKSAAAYAAIKSAIRSFTQAQSLLLIPHGIRVNSVAPGATSAPDHFWEERRRTNDQRYLDAVGKQPTGRLGQPEDIAGVVMFLASEASAWVIGQTIVADGGLVANGG